MAFQVGCGDEGLDEQRGCIAQHVELAKLRHVQVVGELEEGEGMLFHEEDGVVLFADLLDGLEAHPATNSHPVTCPASNVSIASSPGPTAHHKQAP